MCVRSTLFAASSPFEQSHGAESGLLPAEDTAALAADQAALKGAVARKVMPKLNFPLEQHVISEDMALRQAAQDVLDQFQQMTLPRSVQTTLRDAQAAIKAQAARAAAARQGKPSTPSKRKRKQHPSSTS